MLSNYLPVLIFLALPVLIFLALSFAMGAIMVSLGYFLGTRRPDGEKLSPYECGFESFEDARMKFDVRYYLVAILFIILWPSCSSFSTWKSRFCFPGRSCWTR